LYISRVRGPGRGGKKGKKRRKKDDEGASEEGPAEGEEGEEKEEEEEEGEEEAVLVGDAPQDKATPENADKVGPPSLQLRPVFLIPRAICFSPFSSDGF
jgi:hypothetical protein